MCQLSAWSDLNMLLFSLWLLCPSLLPGMDGFCILVKVCGFVIFVACVGYKWVWGEDSVSPGCSQCLCLVTRSRLWFSCSPTKTEPENRWGSGKSSQPELWGFEEWFVSSPYKGKSSFHWSTSSSPTAGKYQFGTSAACCTGCQGTETLTTQRANLPVDCGHWSAVLKAYGVLPIELKG